jgi:hypothetical protein
MHSGSIPVAQIRRFHVVTLWKKMRSARLLESSLLRIKFAVVPRTERRNLLHVVCCLNGN